MRSTAIIVTILILTMASCTEDPSRRVLENYQFNFSNSNESRLLAGESLDVSAWFQVYTNTSASVDSVKVIFEPVQGGGYVSQEREYVSSGNSIGASWTLGHDSFRQVLRASVWDLSGYYITSTYLVAYGFRENQWDKLTDSPETRIMGMAADTVNDVTFMVTVNKLYRQGEKYFIWEEVTDPKFQSPDSPREVEIDRAGVFYVSTSGGNIFRSADHGDSWQACTKPWPERSHYLHLHVSNDNRLWIYTPEETVRYSDDGGTTWHNAGSGMTQTGVADIFRLGNGSLVMHGLNCCSLMMSDDDGQTWTGISTPDYTQKLYVNDDDEIFICADVGVTEKIYSSKDLGTTFGSVHTVAPSFRTLMDNVFNKWGDFYYVAIPGYGIMKSNDLHDYEAFWINAELVNLFIDHNGVLMVKDYDYRSVYYLKSNP